jgi:hypothetical protein
MTTMIGNLVFRAAAGMILGALTCAGLAAPEVNNIQQFFSKS